MATAYVASTALATLRSFIGKAMEIVKDKPLEFMIDKATTVVVDKFDGIVNIQRDIDKLQKTLCMIEGIVAEEKQIDDVSIRNWLQDLVDIGYEARDVLDDFITFSSCIITAEEASNPVNFISSFMLSYFGGLSSDTSNIPLATLNRLENGIRSVRERFDEKIKEIKTSTKLKSVVVGGGGSESVRVDRRPEVGPFINKQGDNLFLGREKVKEEIMEKLLHPSDDHRVHVIAIWGMGGIGKTTLAQFIYNDERVKEDDYPTKNRSWLCVGESKFSAEKVIKEIVDDQNTTAGIGNLQKELVRKLRGDRFLIVLDDVWDVDGSEWKLLFNPLTHVGKGGLIILTTRKSEVCTATNTETTHNLKPLSKEDSWSIFESCAYGNGKSDCTPYLKGIGKEIVKKLNGLPLALEVVGCSLLNEDDSNWTNFLNSNADDLMSALRWSYNLLRPPHLRSCFAYCALFPKDHVFDEKVLVEMWMAHDLIQKEKQKRPEDIGANYFKKLVNASLLQCVDGKYVMHDLIHDLALLVSNEEFASTSSSFSNDQMEKVRHFTIIGDYPKNLRLCKSKRILTLYTMRRFLWGASNRTCFNIYVLLDDFKSSSIRVLVLSQEEITEIPDCISELRHLRYLDVKQTTIKSLPDSLCHLYHLQMIAVPYCVKLPIDIVNISSLRYVRGNLSTCKGVGKLTSLQELSSIYVCEGDNIRELGDMQRLCGKLRIKDLENATNLEDVAELMEKQTLMDELELIFKHPAKSTFSVKVSDALRCPPYLKIVGYTGLKPPTWMEDGNLVSKLQTLELWDCPKLESLPPLGELTTLKHVLLRKVGVKRLGHEFYGKFSESKVFFPSLESLRFYEMQECEEWGDIIIDNSSMSFFPCLTSLEIYDCPKLVLVLPTVKTLKRKLRKDKHPTMSAANFMKSLSRLSIRDCYRLKRLQLGALVSLKDLDVGHCNSLVQITSAACLATTIERLAIFFCEHLETMDFERLPSLKHLEIGICDKLISVPCLQGGIKYLNIHTCESLKALTFNIIDGLDSLEDLTILKCPVLELAFEEGSSSSYSSEKSVAVRLCIYTDKKKFFTKLFEYKFGFLESLEIKSVTEFENFNETEENNFYELKSLKILRIKSFRSLQSLPANFHRLSSLNSLTIVSCPKLQSLPRDFHKLSSLSRLHIGYCPQLQSLPLDFYKLSSLEELHIKSCKRLQSLPPDFHKLSSLSRLHIEDCPQLQSLPPNFHKLSSLEELDIKSCERLQSLPPDFHKLSSLSRLHIRNCPQLQSLKSSINSLVIAYQQPLEERCKLESGHVWHQIKHIRDIYLSDGEHNDISVLRGTLAHYSEEEEEEEEE